MRVVVWCGVNLSGHCSIVALWCLSHHGVCGIMGLSPILGFVAKYVALCGLSPVMGFVAHEIWCSIVSTLQWHRTYRLCPGTAFRNCAQSLGQHFFFFLSSFYNISNQLFLHFNTLINKSELFLFRRWVGLAVSVPASRPPVPGKNLGPGGGGLPTVWSEGEQICTVIM